MIGESTRAACLVLLTVSLSSGASPLLGQARLSVRLVSDATGSPVSGALVSLRRSNGDRVDGALSDDSGHVELEASSSGRYRVSVQRMGFDRWRSAPLRLGDGEREQRTFRLPVRPVQLEDLSVTARSQCGLQRGEGREIQRLWRAVREGLDVAAWSERRYGLDLVNRRRLLDPDGTERRVVATWRESGVGGPPYRSARPATLLEEGFIQERADSLAFYAPSVETLLSAEFRREHCFSVRRDSAGRFGLQFWPTDGREVPDVRGTLWLAGSPPRLRTLRYRYTDLPVDVPQEHLGGRLEFGRVDGGGWVVHRWWIRMPRAEVVVPEAPTTMIRSSPLDREARLRTIVERGGRVVGVADAPADSTSSALPAEPVEPSGAEVPELERARDTLPEESGVRIVGRVVDLGSGDPVPSAAVLVPARDRRARTDDQGRFELAGLPPGSHSVRVRHVRYGQQSVDVRLPSSETVNITVRLPPQAVEVEDVEVTVEARSPSLERTGFYERRSRGRKLGRGTFLTDEDISGVGARTSHVLGMIPGLSTRRGLPVFNRHRLGFDGTCLPAIYLDGHKVVGSSDDPGSYAGSLGARGINSLVSKPEIEGIEAYDSPASTAGEFQASDSRCGVIVIWTE